jgi:PAS domain S-box-containing protein
MSSRSAKRRVDKSFTDEFDLVRRLIDTHKFVSRSPSEQHHPYRDVVENQVEMVCRFRRDGTILFVNSAYARARGTTAEALAGADFWGFIPEAEHDAVARLLDSLSIDNPEIRIENRFTTATGERWTMWTNRAVSFDDDGRPTEFQSSGLDITERRRVEEALRASESRYRYIFETAGVSIWDEDFSAVKRAIEELKANGIRDFADYFAHHPDFVEHAVDLVRIREVNPATLRMFGARERSELVGSLRTVFITRTRDVFVRELIAIAEGRSMFEAETVVQTLDGQTRNVIFTITFPPPTDDFSTVLVTLTDITERKRMEAHLRETAEALQLSNRMKDEFLATLSHELRTPLNAVLGWAHMLRTGSLAPDVAGRALESLERNARAQSQLIDDLLDMSRIASGRLQMASDIVDLACVAMAAIDTIRPAATTKGVELHVSTPPDEHIVVRGDADRLRQVLWNLLSNAVKFTPSGGRVHLELHGDGPEATVVIRDTGEGIDPHFLPFVFERFRQADATSTRRHGGLGLGLSIARHLAEAHGGRITVHSDGRNCGATFTLHLPRERVRDYGAPALQANFGSPLSGTSILVVDDDADARELFRVALELAGAQVTVVGRASDALHHLRTHPVDLLIADIGMPECDGAELMRAVRAMPAPVGRLPAIAVTAYTTSRERTRMFEAGFNAHVAKPMEVERLVAAAMDLLRRHPAQSLSEGMR